MCIHVYLYVYMYVCIYICVYLYIYEAFEPLEVKLHISWPLTPIYLHLYLLRIRTSSFISTVQLLTS